MIRNPVAKHLNTFNKPSVINSKRRLLQSDATLQEMSESLLNEAVGPKTITFESGSEVHWDESEDCCKSALDSVNCSSVSIDDIEDD